MRPNLLQSLSLVVVLCLTTLVAAQDHQNLTRSISVGHSFGADEVDLFNGNMMYSLPIGQQYPVNGTLSYGTTLHYNSRPWEWRQRCDTTGNCYTQAVPNASSNAGLGWRMSFGELIRLSDPRNNTERLIYESPSGSQHVFYRRPHEGDPSVVGTEYTRDSTYARLKILGSDAYGSEIHEIEMADGTIHRFVAGQITQIRDRFSNTIGFTYSYTESDCANGTCASGTKTITVTDQHGRQQFIRYAKQSPATNYHLTQIDLSGFNATRSVYNFTNTIVSIPRGCGDTDPLTATSVDVSLLSGITFPDGSSYAMPLYSSDAANCQSGLLRKLRLPTQGSIEWDYTNWTFPIPAGDTRGHRYTVPGVAKRRLVDADATTIGEWQIQPQLAGVAGTCPGRERVTTLISPRGTATRSYFSAFIAADGCANTEGWSAAEYGLPLTHNTSRQTSAGRFLSSEIFDDSAATQRLRTLFVRYESEAFSGLLPDRIALDRNRRQVSSRLVYDDDGGRYADTDYSSFDGLGHYRQVTTGGNFDAGNVTTSFTNYNPGLGTLQVDAAGNRQPGYTTLAMTAPWVTNTFTETSVSENAVALKTHHCFESATGFLLRSRVLNGDSQTASDIVSIFTRDSSGNRVREQRYGSDLQWLPTGDLCSATYFANDQLRVDHAYQHGMLKTSQHYENGAPVSFKSLDRDIDFGTGLVSVSRDTAAIATSYTYDSVGQLRWLIPETGHDGRVEHVYTVASGSTTPARADKRQWNNGGTAILAQTQVVYDAFGRIRQEKTLMPSGSWSTREYGYHPEGWTAYLSEQELSTSPANRTTSSNFDAFGRARAVTAPDGKTTTTAFVGDRAILQTTRIRTAGDATNIVETDSVTTRINDRQGRLYQVIEPSRADGSSNTTQYAYDAAGRTISIISFLPQGQQTRLFTYDRRGFLTREQQPELGSSGNGAIDYSGYNVRGQYRWKADSRVTLNHTYDGVGRTVSVSSNGRIIKEFSYAAANGQNGDRSNGKLRTAVRHNYTPAFDAVTTVTDWFAYGGKGGRISRRDTSVDNGPTVTHELSYDDLGNVAQNKYPTCINCMGLMDASEIVTNTRTNGLLTAVSSAASTWASAITYHPNGLISQVSFGNATTWTQQNDPWSMPRPHSIAMSGANVNWSSGIYRYDGAGSVASIGSDYLLYDAVKRVKEGTALTAGSNKQSYSFDANGNITSKTTVVGGTSSTTTLATDWSTNRLMYQVYDASGNLTQNQLNGNLFSYDGFNMLIAIDNGVTGRSDRYLYTADDQRIASMNITDGRTVWRYRDTDGKVLTEYVESAGTWIGKNYIYRDNVLLASYSPREWPYRQYFAVDASGTPRQTIDGLRQQLSQHAYYPFGEEATNSAVDNESMKFGGMERDMIGGTGDLDLRKTRYYSPSLGRAQSVDISAAGSCAPQSLNGYSSSSRFKIATNDAGYSEEITVKGTPIFNADVVPMIPWMGWGGTTRRPRSTPPETPAVVTPVPPAASDCGPNPALDPELPCAAKCLKTNEWAKCQWRETNTVLNNLGYIGTLAGGAAGLIFSPPHPLIKAGTAVGGAVFTGVFGYIMTLRLESWNYRQYDALRDQCLEQCKTEP